MLFNKVVTQAVTATVTGLPIGTRITLSVTALANGTVEGDNVTVVGYTGNSGLMVSR